MSLGRLVVIGAGPKGLAVALKAAALARLGRKPPKVILIDSHGVGENWTGKQGYTDGNEELATPPDLDLGYPYCSKDESLNEIMRQFSWRAFLQHGRRYASWIDKGSLPPTHGEWAEYLKWAIVHSKVDQDFIEGRVVKATWHSSHWRLEYRRKGAEALDVIDADGFVITGPGAPKDIPILESHESLTDGKALCTGRSFWYRAQLDQFKTLTGGSVAVVGGGDTAATIVAKLSGVLAEGVQLAWLTRTGSLYTRSESFSLRRYYSDPMAWVKLPLEVRRRLMATAHEGVVSLRTLNRLNSMRRSVEYQVGDVRGASWNQNTGRVSLSISVGKNLDQEHEFDRVVSALGFDALSCEAILPDHFFPERRDRSRLIETVSERIGEDLSYKARGVATGVHLPMLSALKRGPGLSTMGCLGAMADCILTSYCALW